MGMHENKLKVILLTHGGASRLIELLRELDEVEIAGIFMETETERRRSLKEKFKRSLRYDGVWETMKKFPAKVLGGKTKGEAEIQIIRGDQDETREAAEKYGVPLHLVKNFHDETSIELLKSANADLGIIAGTNIIRENVFSIPGMGSINLHQGLAPYYRGGPTVFWELFNDEKQLGITIHFVAAKVDTGDIILQKTFPLEYDFPRYGMNYEAFLEDYRAGLREPSIQLLTEAVRLIAVNQEQRVKQDTSLGKRNRLPVKKEKDEMRRRLKSRLKACRKAEETSQSLGRKENFS
jgi:folate-dependent phosphoribosylglycinamide formyltransferase PurN